MKVSRATTCETAEANFTTKMEGITKDSGKITKWMGLADCTTKVES